MFPAGINPKGVNPGWLLGIDPSTLSTRIIFIYRKPVLTIFSLNKPYLIITTLNKPRLDIERLNNNLELNIEAGTQ